MIDTVRSFLPWRSFPAQTCSRWGAAGSVVLPTLGAARGCVVPSQTGGEWLVLSLFGGSADSQALWCRPETRSQGSVCHRLSKGAVRGLTGCSLSPQHCTQSRARGPPPAGQPQAWKPSCLRSQPVTASSEGRRFRAVEKKLGHSSKLLWTVLCPRKSVSGGSFHLLAHAEEADIVQDAPGGGSAVGG